MKLRQVYDALEHLHLESLSLSNEGAGIQEIDIPKINIAINQALTDIYNDFNIRTDEVFLRVINGMSMYKLSSLYADSNTESTELVRWIVDSEYKPFKDDIKYIKRVVNSCGEPIQMNDPNYCYAVFTPSFDTIQLSNQVLNCDKFLSIIYAVNPQLIPTSTDTDIDSVTIDLPQNLFNLLVVGTCSYIFKPKGNKDMYYKGINYKAEYEQEKLKITNLGLYADNFNENDNFEQGGWK